MISTHRFIQSSLFTLMLAVTPLCGSDGNGQHSGMPEAPLPTRAQVKHAIELSGGYLERACGPDGKFIYQIDINTGKQSSAYNIVRHAGAMYALAMLNRSNPDPKAVEAMIRAAAFMRQSYIGLGVRPDQLAVWSEPTPHPSDAELGATGVSGLRTTG